MMEQTDSGKGHRHTIFIATLNNQIIPHRASRLSNIFYPAFSGTLNIIAEREEGI